MMWGTATTATGAGTLSAWDALAPQPVESHVTSTLLLGLWVVALVMILPWVARAQQRVEPEGRLFDWLTLIGGAVRATAILTVGLLLLTTLPAKFTHLSPWLLLAAVIGAGFTLRDVAGSVLAWVILLTEGKIQPGAWVVIHGHSGTVRRLGPRVLWMIDASGKTLSIPNQWVLRHTTQIDDSPHPIVHVEVRVPEEIPEHAAASVLREVTLTAPWVAPGAEAKCRPSPNSPRVWRVETRVLGASMRDALEAHLATRLTQSHER